MKTLYWTADKLRSSKDHLEREGGRLELRIVRTQNRTSDKRIR